MTTITSKLALNGGPQAVTRDPGDIFKWPIVTPEDEEAVLEVLRRGAMSGTDVTKQFEQECAAWLGTKYALGYCNGTASLLGAMWACGLGAGDVKLMAAVGALAPMSASVPGWSFVLLAMMYTALVGAAIAIGILIWQKRLLQGLKDSARTLVALRVKRPPQRPTVHVPYGLAIGVGTIWAWFETMLL